MRCCAFIGFNLRSLRFFRRLCLGFFIISLGLMARVWMDGFFLVLVTLSGFYICLSWWSILLIERYLVAKIGTTSWFRCGGSSSLSLIMRDWSGFITILVVVVFNKCFHQIGMIAS